MLLKYGKPLICLFLSLSLVWPEVEVLPVCEDMEEQTDGKNTDPPWPSETLVGEEKHHYI